MLYPIQKLVLNYTCAECIPELWNWIDHNFNFSFIIDLWSPCSASCGEGIRFRKVECKIFLEFSKTVATLPDRECPGLKPPETEICVDKPSCGPDQILSDNVNIVSETLPIVNGPEILPLISEEEKEPVYAWKIAGFTTCTASCLGGKIIHFRRKICKLYFITYFRPSGIYSDLRGKQERNTSGALLLWS